MGRDDVISRLWVFKNIFNLIARLDRVDRNAHGSKGENGEIADQPLHRIFRMKRNPLSTPDSELIQPHGKVSDGCPEGFKVGFNPLTSSLHGSQDPSGMSVKAFLNEGRQCGF